MQCRRRLWESMALTRATHFRSCTSRTPSRVTSRGHTPRCSSKTFLQTFMCRYCCPGPTPLSLPSLCVLTWSSTALCRLPGHQAVEDPRMGVRGAEHPGEIVSDGRRGGAEVKPPVWFENAAHGELMLKERCVHADALSHPLHPVRVCARALASAHVHLSHARTRTQVRGRDFSEHPGSPLRLSPQQVISHVMLRCGRSWCSR